MKHLLTFTALSAILFAATAHADLKGYVSKPDASYKLEVGPTTEKGSTKIYELKMTSQTWRDIKWEHRIQIFVPDKAEIRNTSILYIVGGSGSASDTALGVTAANTARMPFAVLYNIPNQPLFDRLTEDALISYTYTKFLESGDEEWPLLFPMAKSAVRAMDAIQSWSKSIGSEITGFVVTGGSKRGWTTWLTAATGDKRVKGIAPIVIDTLNMPKQMPHQLEMWGEYSEMIADYTRRGIQQQMNTERGRKLTSMVDPYSYRAMLTLPKLIMNGANDPYWATDALNLYWDDLKGPKYIFYGANSGHGMENSIIGVLSAMSNFARSVSGGPALATPKWKYSTTATGVKLVVEGGALAQSAKLWVNTSTTKDFRKTKWIAKPMVKEGDSFAVEVEKPVTGNVAVFGEIAFKNGGDSYPLCTQVHIMGSGVK